VTSPDDLELIATAPVVTTRYSFWKPEHGVPIRTSVGAPKWWAGPALVQVRSLTPFGIFGRDDLDADEARALYRERLDHYAERVVSDLADLARQHPGKALVVMCFEDLTRPDTYCHRGWLAKWFEETYRIQVTELPPDQPRLPLT
jgi:hypothetical protein